MTRLGKAIAIASRGHAEQVDKEGTAYILHPLTCMMRVKHLGESAMIVAVLHDFVEDCEVLPGELDFLTVTERYALDCVTKRNGESYHDRITRCMTSPLAMAVKEQDLIHNLDASRMPSEKITDNDLRRWGKYRMALDRIRTAQKQYNT